MAGVAALTPPPGLVVPLSHPARIIPNASTMPSIANKTTFFFIFALLMTKFFVFKIWFTDFNLKLYLTAIVQT
jgi:hypothetical protein